MSTGCLALHLTGPLQSWGLASRSVRRDTGLEPSKSGVIGLLAAALGLRRDDPIDDLARLRMTVRVDREGEIMEDYQTVGVGYSDDPVWPGGGLWTAKGQRKFGRFGQLESFRLHLADAAFLVLFEGDLATLEKCFRALRSPEYQLALGRRACPPAQPIAPWAPAAVDAGEVLKRYPRIRSGTTAGPLRVLRELTAAEVEQADELRPDQPLGFLVERRFGPRPIRHDVVRVPAT